ncbi:MAG: pitrilysin family protein [Phycisphaerae bacterium]
MAEKIDRHILKNGMAIIGEPMESVQSVAFGFMLPAGAARLPAGCCGAANIIEDWVFRGAADMDSRTLGDKFDSLGLHRISSVGTSHLTFGSALQAENLDDALDLYTAVILQPQLKDELFEPARQLAVDGLLSLDDDPRHKVMLKLKEQFYGEPLGRSTEGEKEQLQSLTAEKTKQIIRDNFNIPRTIFAIAGKYDFDAVCKKLEQFFGNMPNLEQANIEYRESNIDYTHIENKGEQVHIGIMTATAKPQDDDYYDARMAVSVLSGGMSARLFTEVREKRGLCYAIGANYHGLKQAAGIICYAGTIPQTAQTTLDVIIEQFENLSKEITEEEIERAKTGLKSALILSSESSSSRAGQIAGDYYLLGRVRSLDEIKQKIDQTSVESVTQYLKNNPFKHYTVVTIGPKRVNWLNS